MTATLTLRLAGPLQSWGVTTHTPDRPTGLEPTKSGVVGLCAAALGISRGEPLDHLTTLAMGVRVDQEGHLERDFQTLHPHPRAGENHLSTTVSPSGAQLNSTSEGARIRRATYLADACFVVSLTGDESLLQEIADAFNNPTYPLGLGRAAFPLSRPPIIGITAHTSPSDALAEVPWQATEHYRTQHPEVQALRGIVETDDLRGEVVTDVPTPKLLLREWTARRVTHTSFPIPSEVPAAQLNEIPG